MTAVCSFVRQHENVTEKLCARITCQAGLLAEIFFFWYIIGALKVAKCCCVDRASCAYVINNCKLWQCADTPTSRNMLPQLAIQAVTRAMMLFNWYGTMLLQVTRIWKILTVLISLS